MLLPSFPSYRGTNSEHHATHAYYERRTKVSMPPTFRSWGKTTGAADHPSANCHRLFSLRTAAQRVVLQNLRSEPFTHLSCTVQVLTAEDIFMLRRLLINTIFPSAAAVPKAAKAAVKTPPQNWPLADPVPAFDKGICDFTHRHIQGAEHHRAGSCRLSSLPPRRV